MRSSAAGVFVATLIVGSTAGRPTAQQVTGGASGTPIQLDVSVTDASAQPVRGLTAADFAVTEDGRAVQIQAVTDVDVPGAGSVGRTYIIAVDSLHLTSRGAVGVGAMIEQFVDQYLAAQDRAAVVILGPSSSMAAATADHQQLLRAIGIASASARTASEARRGGMGFGTTPVTLPDIHEAAVRAFATLTTALGRVAHEPGRRVAVLFISEGVPLEGRDTREAAAAQQAFLAAAARENATVYPLNPAGMSTISSGVEPSSEFEPAGLAGWQSLRSLANDTGGLATLGLTDLASAYRQIVQDTSSYYVLTYASPHGSERDGHFHGVRVHVNRRGSNVRTRNGWYEPK
jgi:VWFA-related protein